MPEQIYARLCKHIIYAFAKIVDDKLVVYEWNDEDTAYSKSLFSKKQNPRLKVLLDVGGCHHGLEPFSRVVHDEAKRPLRRLFEEETFLRPRLGLGFPATRSKHIHLIDNWFLHYNQAFHAPIFDCFVDQECSPIIVSFDNIIPIIFVNIDNIIVIHDIQIFEKFDEYCYKP
ncbi:acidic mammalian chitinase-like [Brachionus plicatilis]|uniref:Acidic mammalian chitinase-like n=1 Tax=Brachionus plicatilis TaxID=10195 RepID=A0A3M7Q4D3_BRAPC|nr:acidic mammalian chitinase-like [Brachionus plicatilis]